MFNYLISQTGRDTIFAPASGVGRAAVAVIRSSGPRCDMALQALTFGGELPEERRVTLRTLRDPESGEALDRALVVRFPAPRSFTGEDMLEIHVTGGRAVLGGVLEALGKIPGLRPSEPGEFAWRAFENGKLDLSEVEGLAGLVDAETAAQRRQAVRVAGGALRREAESIRALILRSMTILESLIDFSDVEDAASLDVAEAKGFARDACERIQKLLAAGKAGIKLHEGLLIVIAGPANAGKSTLMNALAMRDVSIVSAVPGTTRDLVEVALDLNGFPVTLVDTAGIRDSDDPVEKEGIARARRRGKEGDLIIWLMEKASESPFDAEKWDGVEAMRVLNKVDVDGAPEIDGVLGISAKTGEGLSELVRRIGEFAAEHFHGAADSLITTERHRIAFEDARDALTRFAWEDASALELMAEDLRLAARATERLGGRIEVDDVLSSVFGRLCVGK
jgi:tRNA modification GTPase